MEAGVVVGDIGADGDITIGVSLAIRGCSGVMGVGGCIFALTSLEPISLVANSLVCWFSFAGGVLSSTIARGVEGLETELVRGTVSLLEAVLGWVGWD